MKLNTWTIKQFINWSRFFFKLWHYFTKQCNNSTFVPDTKINKTLTADVILSYIDKYLCWIVSNYCSVIFLVHLTQGSCELLLPLSVCRPSVNFSHFNQLLWSHWANLNQTLVEWSLDGPLLNLCPVIPTSNQDGHQAKNRKKKGGWNFNCPLLL